MSGRAAALAVCAALALPAAAVAAPVAVDPSAAGQGTTLLIAADAPALSSAGQSAESLTAALARGTRFDSTSVTQLCDRSQAARGTCPAASRIGFGRFVVAVRGYLLGGGDAELSWSLDAFLAKPVRSGDPASVVLKASLLGADTVAALLEPSLGTKVARTATTTGRVVRPASGAYGVELQFPKLPVQVDLASPVTATPTDLELSLSAVRRVRENFVRHIRVRMPGGYQVREIPDHHLIGHYLFRTPRSCSGSWPSELRVGFGNRVKRTPSPIGCTTAATAARR